MSRFYKYSLPQADYQKQERKTETVQVKLPPRELTKAEAEQMDREQPHRIQLSTPSRDNFITLVCIARYLELFSNNSQLVPVLKQLGVYNRMRSASCMLNTAMSIALKNVSVQQLRVMDAVWSDTTYLYISSSKQVHDFINVDGDVLKELIRNTIKHCQEGMCMKSKKEAASCPVKKILDACPSSGHFIYDVWKGTDVCPYSICNPDKGEYKP